MKKNPINIRELGDNIRTNKPYFIDLIVYLENGGDVNYAFPYEWRNTLLTQLVKYGRYDGAKLILQNWERLKLDVNKKSSDNFTTIGMLASAFMNNLFTEEQCINLLNLLFKAGEVTHKDSLVSSRYFFTTMPSINVLKVFLGYCYDNMNEICKNYVSENLKRLKRNYPEYDELYQLYAVELST